MTPALRRKLEALLERREEVERLLADPAIAADQTRFRNLSREFAGLQPVADALAAEAQARADLAAAQAMQLLPGHAEQCQGRAQQQASGHRFVQPEPTTQQTGTALPVSLA